MNGGTMVWSHWGSYEEFTQRLIDKFHRKHPDIHFRELAMLKQTASPDDFITEFERISLMVTDISEERLVMLFIEALAESCRDGFENSTHPPSREQLRRLEI